MLDNFLDQLFSGKSLIAVLFLVLLLSSFRCVPVGHQGVVKILGKVKHEKVLNEGFHMVKPFITSIYNMNIKLLKFEQEASASSKDLQLVTTVVTVQFSLSDVSNLFQKVGNEESVISITLSPAVQESVKAVTAKYTAEQLITKRSEVKIKISEAITDFINLTMREKEISISSLRISNVAITDFNFSAEFNKSIEMKVKAEQQALQAKNEKIKKITDSEAVAEKIRLESIAKANAIRREAKALRENPQLIEWKRMEKWDGKLPEVTGGYIPMFDVGGKKHRRNKEQ